MSAIVAAFLVLTAPAGAPATCAIPAVQLAEPDKGFAAKFASGTAPRRRAEANVGEAFRAACSKNLIAGEAIPKLSGVPTRLIFLENWPDANVASIEADQLTGGTGWRLMLGYPFVAIDGSVNVPSADEIEEAIYCAVRGATEQEQEESGRCLPD